MPSSHSQNLDQAPLLHAYCHRCARWRVLEADVYTVDFSVDGHGPDEAVCPSCGEHGLVRARLPAQVPAVQPMLLTIEDVRDERWRVYF